MEDVRAVFIEESHKYVVFSEKKIKELSIPAFSLEKVTNADGYDLDYADVMPSVTTLIKEVNQDGEFIVDDFSGVPIEIVERAGNIGTAVHAAIEWGAELDRNTLPEEVNRHYIGYEKFLAEHDVVFGLMELPLMKVGEKPFAGMIDAIARVDGKNVIIDWKTGKNVTVANKIQQAAYKDLLSSYDEKYSDYEKWIVKLNKDCTYEIIVISEKYDEIWQQVLEKYYNATSFLDVKAIKKEAHAKISEELAERYICLTEELENKKQQLDELRQQILLEIDGEKAIGGRLTVSMTKNTIAIDEGKLSEVSPEIHKACIKSVYTGKIDIDSLRGLLRPEVFLRVVRIDSEESVFDEEKAAKLVKEKLDKISGNLYRIAKKGSWRFNIAKEK